jgi:hypothetical protein
MVRVLTSEIFSTASWLLWVFRLLLAFFLGIYF